MNTVIIEDALGIFLEIHADKNQINFNTTNFSDQTNVLIGNVNNEAHPHFVYSIPKLQFESKY